MPPKKDKPIAIATAPVTVECNVCYSSLKEGSVRQRKLECPSCAYLVCIPCQKQYGKLECMNCRTVFRNKWAIDLLGAVFVSKTVRQNKIRELMLQQREELKSIQPLVEWEQRCRQLKKTRKYGVWSMHDMESELKKPDRLMGDQTFPCATPGCRGHVRKSSSTVSSTVSSTEELPGFEEKKEDNDNMDVDVDVDMDAPVHMKDILVTEQQFKGSCGLCHVDMCLRCQEKWHGHLTKCNADTLETIVNIRADTKPCPKCRVAIHRTMGCDHMHCTACNTHFSWHSGTVIHDTTNFHYRDQLLQNLRRQRPHGGQGQDQNGGQGQGQGQGQNQQEECRISDDEPRIPQDTMDEKWENIFRLWNDKARHARRQLRQNNFFSAAMAYLSKDKDKEDIVYEEGTVAAWNDHAVKKKLETLMDGLYNVPKAVRSMIRKEYSMARIAEKTRDKYDELQIKYALNEIQESSWETQVYSAYIKQLVSELVSNVLYIYLGNIDDVQSHLFAFDGTMGPANGMASDMASTNGSASQEDPHRMYALEPFLDACMQRVDALIEMCNDSINEIRLDYCPTTSNQIMIRKLGETNQSYCTKQGIEKGNAMSYVKPIPTERPANMANTPIHPYDYQLAHIERLETILQTSHFAIDLSPLGTGKTYTAAKIYQNATHIPFRHLLAVSPLSVKTKWCEVNETYNLELIDNLTYNEIGGRRGMSPAHGLLLRNDYQVEVEDERTGETRLLEKYVFTPTAYFRQLIENGVLVVFDEFQHLKNDTAQTAAAECMVVAVMDAFAKMPVCHSRVLFMSGSPVDKEEQVARMFRTLGIMRHPRIVSGRQYAGINEVIDWLEVQFPNHPYLRDTVRQVSWYDHETQGYEQQADTAKIFMYRWFVDVLCGQMTSTMIMPPDTSGTGITLQKYNGIYETGDQYMQQKVAMAVESLQNISQRFRNQEIHSSVAMQQVTLRMMQIETAKIDLFARLSREYLTNEKQKQTKVVVAVNYTDTIRELCSLLAEYQPLVMDGSKTLKQRRQILRDFQESSNEHRLLLGNFSVLSTGIDLDDKDGRFPRVCLASPNYSTISIYQLGHRFLRGKETKSGSEIYMVYTNTPGERKITESLMRKGNVMKEVLADQVNAGITFPSDYVTIHRSFTTTAMDI